MGRLKEKKWVIFAFYAFIGLAALFLRTYMLGVLPAGIHVDEAGMAYDAFSIANWGLDRYYKFYPLYLINYGSGQSVLYAYILAFLIKLFDLEVTAALIRTPAVIFGMITWVFGTLLIRENLGEKAGLAGSALLAVCPCFIMNSRLGLDCNLFLGMSVISVYLLSRALKYDRYKSWIFFFASGAAFGITLYTYALSWLVVPVFVIFTAAYLIYIKKITVGGALFFCIPLAFFALPLIVVFLINTFDLPEIATVYITFTKLPVYRVAEVSVKNVINNIPELIQAYFFYDELPYNSIGNWFTMYVVSIPFAVYGIGLGAKDTLDSFKRKVISIEAVIFLWFTAVTVMGLITYDLNVNKLNAVYFALIYFTVKGLKYAWGRISHLRSGKAFAAAVTALYGVFALSFCVYYFTDYTDDYVQMVNFRDTFSVALDEFEEVIGDKDVYTDATYVFYALGEKLSPMELQLVELGSDDRGNIHFWFPDEADEDAVYILTWNNSKKNSLLEEGFAIHYASDGTIVMYKE